MSPGSVFNQMVCEAPNVSFLVDLTTWKFGADFAEVHLVQQNLTACLHTDYALPLSYTVILSSPYHFLSIKNHLRLERLLLLFFFLVFQDKSSQ